MYWGFWLAFFSSFASVGKPAPSQFPRCFTGNIGVPKRLSTAMYSPSPGYLPHSWRLWTSWKINVTEPTCADKQLQYFLLLVLEHSSGHTFLQNPAQGSNPSQIVDKMITLSPQPSTHTQFQERRCKKLSLSKPELSHSWKHINFGSGN
jgi:hypothetical protein